MFFFNWLFFVIAELLFDLGCLGTIFIKLVSVSLQLLSFRLLLLYHWYKVYLIYPLIVAVFKFDDILLMPDIDTLNIPEVRSHYYLLPIFAYIKSRDWIVCVYSLNGFLFSQIYKIQSFIQT